MLPRVLLCLVSTLGAASAFGAGPITDCEPKGNARPICAFTNPEDMVPLPGNQAILIGEYGASAEEHSGGLVVFELAGENGGRSFAAAKAKGRQRLAGVIRAV